MGCNQAKLEKKYDQLVLQNATLVAQELQNRLSNKPCSLQHFTEQLTEISSEIAKLENLAEQKNVHRDIKYGPHFLKLVNFLLNFKKEWPIGQKEELLTLANESRHTASIQNQINELNKFEIKNFRRTVDDGNSFYRAFGFAFLEYCITSGETSRLDMIIQKLKSQQEIYKCSVPEDTPQKRDFLATKLQKICRKELEFDDMYNIIDKPLILFIRSCAKNLLEFNQNYSLNQGRFIRKIEAISTWGEEATDESIFNYLSGAFQVRLRLFDIKMHHKKNEIPINIYEQPQEHEYKPCNLYLLVRDIYNNRIRFPHFDILYVNPQKIEGVQVIKLQQIEKPPEQKPEKKQEGQTEQPEEEEKIQNQQVVKEADQLLKQVNKKKLYSQIILIFYY